MRHGDANIQAFILVALVGFVAITCSGNSDRRLEDPGMVWAEIPAGAFVFGSPVDTPCRGAVTEKEVPVTLTHPFLISRYEVTQRQWQALGLTVPPNAPLCDDCPVTFINFYEAANWCNRLSELEGLEPCYQLDDCVGTIGSGCPDDDEFYSLGCEIVHNSTPPEPVPDLFRCTGNARTYESMYDCAGYRLPTESEWEYAAKAGTPTNTYNGDITYDSNGWCVEEPILNDIAWYCWNSGAGDTDASPDQIREVGLKQPNPWGLYDILGNAAEWVDYHSTGGSLDQDHEGEAMTDPMGEPWSGEWDERADSRGRGFADIACYMRASWQSPDISCNRSSSNGFRPVRTLPAAGPDAGAK